MFPIRDHNPSETTPFITYAIIAANVLIYLLLPPDFASDVRLSRFYGDWALIPARVSSGEGYETFVTSMFLHGGFLHLAGNMLFLWIFGDNLEEELGHVGFTLFYLATGIAAAGLQFLTEPGSGIPVVGASGAIAGVMGGYLLFFPKARVDVLLFFIIIIKVIPVPAWIMLGLWFGMQVFGGLGGTAGDSGVAYWAHLGGFAAGVVLCLPKWLREGAVSFWSQTRGHPPHPVATYRFERTTIPRVTRRR